MWALVPLKEFTSVKQRLSSALSAIERRSLFRAMVEDLLNTLVNHNAIEKVVILSDDPTARYLAQQFGAEMMSEKSLNARGMNGVIQAGFEQIKAQFKDSHQTPQDIMIIHGDLPLVSHEDLSQLINFHNQAKKSTITIATDEVIQGSNCLIVPSTVNFTFCYGEGSLQKHQSQARKLNLHFQHCLIHGIACDIDYPLDLYNVLDCTKPQLAVNTKNYITNSGIAERFKHNSTATENALKANHADMINAPKTASNTVAVANL